MAPSRPSPTRTPITAITTKLIEQKQGQKLSTHPVRHVEKQTIPQRDAILDPRQPIDHLPGTEDRKDGTRSTRGRIRIVEIKMLKLQPKIKTKRPRLHSGAAIDRLETTKRILPPIPEATTSDDQFKKISRKTQTLKITKIPTHPN